jgi:hypothetical protein
VRWTDSYPPTILPTLTSVPFARVCQESRIKPANRRSGAGAHTRGPITISQRKLLTISPDVRAHITDTPKSADNNKSRPCRATSPTTDADTATDDYSYEAVSLCFKEAREAEEFSGIGKKLTLQHAARRTQGAMPSAAPRRHPLFCQQLFPC